MFENKLVNSDDGVTGDFHRIAHFVKGKPAREISFEPRWDGCAPNEIKYKNISRRLSGEGLEYLPLLVSESAGPRYQHVANIQMKKYGLEGMVGDVQRVPSFNLNPGCKTLQEADEKFGFCVEGFMENVPPSGQVVISNEIKSSEDIIRILAHEFKHVDDLSKVLRLKYNADAFMQLSRSEIAAVKKEMPEVYNFVKKSLKKGVITKKGSDDFEYRHLKFLDKHFDPNHYYKTAATLEGHSIHPLEVGPDRVANEEVEKFNSLMIRILDLLIN